MTSKSVFLVLGCLLAWNTLPASTSEPGQAGGPSQTETPAAKSPQEAWGVQAVALRPTFGGRMLDFRYRVLDPKRAKPLFDGKIQPYLMDPASGAVLGLPGDTSLGDLRSSVRNPPVAGKQYFVLFSNAYGTVKKGSKVSVVMGDCRFTDLVVD